MTSTTGWPPRRRWAAETRSPDAAAPAASWAHFEHHAVDGASRTLHVHRKGATRAWGPGHPGLPPALRAAGQPVLVGGSMGTGADVLAGMAGGGQRAFASACHGGGRAVVDAAEIAGLARKVARLEPLVCVKG